MVVSALFLLLGLTPTTAKGQSYLQDYGIPAFTTQLPIENGFIDMSNGRVHLEIPLASYPQRGGRTDKVVLMYDSNIWVLVYPQSGPPNPYWQPTNVSVSSGTSNSMGGWRLVNLGDAGVFSDTCGSYLTAWWCDNFIWTAPDGTQHAFPQLGIDNNSYYASGYASDGFFMSYGASCICVYAPDGTLVSGTTHVPEDTNGNYYTTSSTSAVNAIDTLGRTPVTTTVSGNTTTYTVLHSQGGSSQYKATTQSTSVSTNFGVSGHYEYSGTITTIQSIQLPDFHL